MRHLLIIGFLGTVPMLVGAAQSQPPTNNKVIRANHTLTHEMGSQNHAGGVSTGKTRHKSPRATRNVTCSQHKKGQPQMKSSSC
jgi:hypothetical protein